MLYIIILSVLLRKLEKDSRMYITCWKSVNLTTRLLTKDDNDLLFNKRDCLVLWDGVSLSLNSSDINTLVVSIIS